MALKTIEEDVSLVLYIDAVFLAKSNIGTNKNVFEIAIQKRNKFERKLNCANIRQLIIKDHSLFVAITKPTMLIYQWSWLRHLLRLMFRQRSF